MITEEQSSTCGAGTQKFMAPEILNEQEYNEKADVYSFGVLLFFILSGGEMLKITVIQIGTGKKAEIPSTFTNFAKNLINECWNFNPIERPSFKEICQKLESNNYKIVELSKSEENEVKDFVNVHKLRIPSFSD